MFKSLRYLLLLPCLLPGVLTLLSQSDASAEPPGADEAKYAGLSRYRTLGGKRAYAPVILRLDKDEPPQFQTERDVVRIKCRAVAYVVPGEQLPRAEKLQGAPASDVQFSLSNPKDKSGLGKRLVQRLTSSRAPYALVLGLRPKAEGEPFVPALPRATGGLCKALFFPAERELPLWIEAAAVYAKLGAADQVDAELWEEVVSIPVPEIRFAALRDIFLASHHRAFGRRPVEERSRLVSRIQEAMGASLTPKSWARLVLAVLARDSDPAVLSVPLRSTETWLRAAGHDDEAVCRVALSVARDKRAHRHASPLLLNLVRAYLRRVHNPSLIGLRACSSLIDLLPGERALADAAEFEREVLAGLLRALESPTGAQVAGAVWQFLHSLVMKYPQVANQLSAESIAGSAGAGLRKHLLQMPAALRSSGPPAALIDLLDKR